MSSSKTALPDSSTQNVSDDVVRAAVDRLAVDDPTAVAEARCRIVETCLPIADAIARRYNHRSGTVEQDDLKQAARTALVAATTRFDPALGTPFVPYAVRSIEGELKRYFRDHSWAVRPPRRLQELRLEASALEEQLRHSLMREPLMQELADALGSDRSDVEEVVRTACGSWGVSLDEPMHSGATLAELLPDAADDFANQVVVHRDLSEAVRGLTPREKQLLHLRFVDERTQSEIGAALGVSQMQVSRLWAAIITKLRSQLLPTAA